MNGVYGARRGGSLLWLAAAATFAALAGPARAQGFDGHGPWAVGVFGGRGVTNDLRNLPYDMLAGDLNYVDSYVGEGVVRYALPVPAWMPGPNSWWGFTQSVEFGGYYYRGFEHNAAFSLDWRPSINLFHLGGAAFDFGYGLGVWRSLGTPWYNHPDHPEYNERYKTLFHMTPELVVRDEALLPGWSVGFRNNHVSGIYGAFAPSSLGTNHLGVSVMKAF